MKVKKVEIAPSKICRLLLQIPELELEVDDWKRNCWILEKKMIQ